MAIPRSPHQFGQRQCNYAAVLSLVGAAGTGTFAVEQYNDARYVSQHDHVVRTVQSITRVYGFKGQYDVLADVTFPEKSNVDCRAIVRVGHDTLIAPGNPIELAPRDGCDDPVVVSTAHLGPYWCLSALLTVSGSIMIWAGLRREHRTVKPVGLRNA